MNDNENLESCESQNKRIRAYLEAGGKLTQAQAYTMFQCFRLASRIHDLRDEGVNIDKEMIITPSGKRVAEYSIKTS